MLSLCKIWTLHKIDSYFHSTTLIITKKSFIAGHKFKQQIFLSWYQCLNYTYEGTVVEKPTCAYSQK